MHHPVSGINSPIHFVSLASYVSTHLLIHLSAHLCHRHQSHHPSLLHSFTSGSKPTFSTNPSHRNTSILDCLHYRGTGPDRTYHASDSFVVLFSLTFLFVPGPRQKATGQKTTGQKATDKRPQDKRPLRQKATGQKATEQKATERNVSIELMEGSVC